jgi:hypothetical protein
MSLVVQHIPYCLLGFATFALVLYELRQRGLRRRKKAILLRYPISQSTYLHILYKLRPSDIPDFLIAFFLVYTSVASFTNMFTLYYILILDGVTCFIAWLYFLKLQTDNDDFLISILIKKSYLFVGRMFISFGPLFMGFVVFACTAFSRYTNLFDSFHKSFISIFCVCYYNMVYEQYRTTERANPISSLFFTTLVMVFTICVYSGMLVSVFCSFMWNKREERLKEELLQSLKIECANCKARYNYAQGYKTAVKRSMRKPIDEDNPHLVRGEMIARKEYLEHKLY